MSNKKDQVCRRHDLWPPTPVYHYSYLLLSFDDDDCLDESGQPTKLVYFDIFLLPVWKWYNSIFVTSGCVENPLKWLFRWCDASGCGVATVPERKFLKRESLPIPSSSSSDYTYTSVDKREKESCCRACSIDGHLRHQFRWISLSICVRPTWTYRLDAIQQKSTDAGDTMLLMPVHWFIDTHAAAGAAMAVHTSFPYRMSPSERRRVGERRRRFVQPTKGVAARGLAGRSSAISLHHRSTLFSDGVDKEVIHIHALPRVPRGFWLLLPLVLMEPASFLSAGHVTRMFPTNWIYYPHRRQHSTTPSPLSLSLCIYIISMIFIHLDELCAAVSPTELCMQKSIVTRLARRLTTAETYTGKKSICACIFIATVSGKESNVMQSPPPKRFRWRGNWSFRLRVCDEREIPKR